MKLRTRLLVFFQGALAAVLLGFSGSLYLLASRHLHHQADERLDSALNTLAAAAEVNAGGVEWEREERRLRFGRGAIEYGLVWRITDDQGRRIDGSGVDAERPLDLRDPGENQWRVLTRRLAATDPHSQGATADEERPPAAEKGFPALRLIAGVSLDGVHDTLNRLALVLASLSLVLWLAMLALGGRLCRRALRPVSAMADAALEIGGEHPDRRLPLPASGDELDHLGRSFNDLLDRLQESFERQRRFTGDASHQLRTPLTTMLGNVDLALKQRRTSEEYEQTLMLVRRKARQMREMIESLLFLARADAESLHPRLATVDLGPWLEGYLQSRQDARRSADMLLERDGGGPTVVQAHPALLSDLLDNLLENAARYSDPGTPIVFRLRGDGASVSVSVVDSGIGIDEADLPLLFEPFYRSKVARDRSSTGVGLGLALADRLARALGTTIEVASRPGEGSSFTVRWNTRRP